MLITISNSLPRPDEGADVVWPDEFAIHTGGWTRGFRAFRNKGVRVKHNTSFISNVKVSASALNKAVGNACHTCGCVTKLSGKRDSRMRNSADGGGKSRGVGNCSTKKMGGKVEIGTYVVHSHWSFQIELRVVVQVT